ncbi:MAG: hypothetical protein H7145_14895 [Akkermansiaceae bacterium]|nr:hypothetical protein [Armatimonadota bacterium]
MLTNKPAAASPAADSELAAPVAGKTITYQAVARPSGGGELIARGNAPSAGFTFFFRDLPKQDAPEGYGAVAPSRFEFRMRRPSAGVPTVVTAFEVTEPLLSLRPGGSVEVVDALGTYTIRVTDTAAAARSPY